MNIPGLGEMTLDEGTDWLCSEPIAVRMLDDAICEIVLEGYEDDPHQEDFHTAITAFLSGGPEVLKAAQAHIFQYYRDVSSRQSAADEGFVAIDTPADVWRHIQFGAEPMVERGDPDERDVYISITCNCDWEREHGLQIVLRNGDTVCKIGPFDGHVTNADAFDDDSLKQVIYRSLA
ncbi:DUF6985 domain-containing protein [Massilia aquatica]|uniref:DUF6985 domain-containing protein n=1 Tax=Massilia aquatica TaxID=2609000 RepID=A0ABX0MBT0_9BURK|nr:hypothetical protein [Massilia aquatica]NHZ41702.1 hypothetical protein [Massilia aquatica]